MTDPNIICINKAILSVDNALQDELWGRGSTERAKALRERLNRLRVRRDNGELYETNF